MPSSSTLSFLFLFFIRIALYGCCRLALPFLFAEARHLSFEPDDDLADPSIPLTSLPNPSTSSASSTPKSASFASTLFSAPDSSTVHQRKLSTANQSSSQSAAQRKADLIHAASALLFSISFEESAFLFVLVLLEAAGFDYGLLRANWNFSLVAVIILGVFFIPLGMCLLFTIRSGFTSTRKASSTGSSLFQRLAAFPKLIAPYLLWALLPFVLWIVVFLKVPLPSAVSGLPTQSANEADLTPSLGDAHVPDSAQAIVANKSMNSESAIQGNLAERNFGYLLQGALTREAVIGVTLIALLSGSGAMSAAWDSWESWFGKKNASTSPSQLRAATSAYQRTLSDLASKKSHLENLRNSPDPESNQTGISNTLGRMWSGSKKSREIKSIEQELVGLSTLAFAMREDLSTMRSSRRVEEWSKSFQGRILLFLGHLFSIYCVFRILLSVLNLVILGYPSSDSSSSSPDFIAYSLALLLRIFDVDVDVSAWTRQISLLFVGFLILGRLRVVLANLSNFFRAASSGVGTSALILFLAEILSVYLLATLIQLRTSLPPSFSNSNNSVQFTQSSSNPTSNPSNPSDPSSSPQLIETGNAPLLSTLPPFQTVFGSLFDSAFLLAAVLTWAIRWLNRRTDDGAMFGGRD